MPRYKGDPHWITVRWSGRCAACGAGIPKGARAFYYPRTRKLYCNGGCGQACESDFRSCAFDESAMTGVW